MPSVEEVLARSPMFGILLTKVARDIADRYLKQRRKERTMIEIAVCESIDRAPTGMLSPATYHVEVRFISAPGVHSICFQGERFKNREKAEADKAYVESVFKSAMLKKPKSLGRTRSPREKPLKERTRTKARRRSRRS